MTRLLIIATAVTCGLGGYWLGQQPGSPDIFGWLSKQAAVLEQSASDGQIKDALDSGRRGLSELLSPEKEAAQPTPPPADRTLSARRPQPADADKRKRPPIPRCW